MPTYTDPNIDFDLEQELLVKALKEAEGQRAARLRGPSISIRLVGYDQPLQLENAGRVPAALLQPLVVGSNASSPIGAPLSPPP